MCGLDVMVGIVFLCDFCDGEYYVKCFDFLLFVELEGEWFCLICVREKENNDAFNVSCCKFFEGIMLYKVFMGEMIIV